MVYQWTDNKTAKRKRTKGQTTKLITLHRKLMIEDTKRVSRSVGWTDNKTAKRKRTNNDLQNITQKTKD